MSEPIFLASGSEVRANLLRRAGVPFEAAAVRVDEASIRASLEEEGASPRDVADTLAEMKARRGSERQPGSLVIGCDQVLDLDGRVLAKPESLAEAREQLLALRGRPHRLLSAAVVYLDGEPLWRHVGIVRLTVRPFSDAFLEDYLGRNWPGLSDSLGGYKLEEEGVRLFTRVEGDYFTVLGLPLVELLSWLTQRGTLQA